MDSLKLFKPNFYQTRAVADNTKVVLRPVVEKKKTSSFPMTPDQKKMADYVAKNPPRQHTIGPAPRIPEKVRKAQEAARKRQENLNTAYQLDPFAHQVNGFRNVGTTAKPQVQKVGPTVFEGMAMLHPTSNFILGTVNTTKQVAKTVKDPSAFNLAYSAFDVAATASGTAGLVKGPLAHSKPLHYLAHNKGMHTAHQIHQGITVGKGLYKTSNIDTPAIPSPTSKSTEKKLLPKLDAGPTIRNLELKKQMGDSQWNELWKQ
jgi:hypothetical protein